MIEQVFLITDSAAKRIKQLLEKTKQTKNTRLRVTVEGGGCSGFQYSFDFDNNLNDDDNIFKHNEIEVVIDNTSMQFLNNAELDYIDELGAAAFKINNPNAESSCGCGNSFSVDIS